MAGLNVYSDLSPKVQGYIDKRALFVAKPTLVAYDLCEKRSLPQGNGRTVAFWRYIPLDKNTTALTDVVTNPLDFGGITFAGRQKLVTREIYVTPEEFGDYIEISKHASMVTVDQDLIGATDAVSQMAAKSIEAVLMKDFATGLTRMRADNDTDYQKKSTTTAAGSTTSIVCSALTQADDYWNGGFITITSGAQTGKTRQITDFANSGGVITCDAFDVAPGSGVTFRVTVGTDIDASDMVSSLAIRRAVRVLENNDTLLYSGAYFQSLLNGDLKYDFINDSDFKLVSIYKNNTDSLTSNDVGTFAGVKFKKTSKVYRETVAGVESTTGDVNVLPILGRHALGCVSLGDGGDDKNFQIYAMTPKSLGQPIPRFSTLGYYRAFKGVVLDAAFGVGLMCGVSEE